MTIQEIINYVDGIKPNAFSSDVKTIWLNEVEGMVQADVMLLAPSSVVTYVYEKTWAGNVYFPDGSTMVCASAPGFHVGGMVTITGLATYADNNDVEAKILEISSDGLTLTFAENTFTAIGETSEAATLTFDGSDTILLVDGQHQRIYYSYILAMIDFANGEYSKYQNAITLFNTFFTNFTAWYIELYHPADGEAIELGYYLSAYSIAVNHGYVGTEEEWLASLQGDRAVSTAEAIAAASAAAGSATAAGTSATNAASSASAASLSAEAALNSKTAAESARDTAVDAMTDLETARDAAIAAKTSALEAAEDSAESAVDAADSETSAATNAQTAITKAAEALASAIAAAGSETVATQALSDFLAMLGTNVATLIDGKLNPSQIPPLSINDVHTVADTAAMLALTAQRGDCALIMGDDVVTDSYLLSADDPTVLANWKKLGVSYVATAGHASTADNATNSEKINNHRMVEMTESQFALAVKDADTYYLVYPEA